jgi:hypothetical protein
MKKNKIKMSKKTMKKFSENMNMLFKVINDLTETEVFESKIVKRGSDSFLYMRILGRDVVLDKKMEIESFGMFIGNSFIPALTGVKSNNPPTPLISGETLL